MNNIIDAIHNDTTDTYKSLISSNLLDNTYQLRFNNKHYNNVSWQCKLITKSSKPDKKLIELAELAIYWNKPQKIVDTATGEKKFIHKFKGKVWQTSYSYLSEKLKCSKDTIRRKLIILEKLGYVRRVFETISIGGQEYNNLLFLQIDNSFYKKVTGFNKVSYSENEGILEQKNSEPYPKKKPPLYIDINNINKDRSMKSKFVKSSFEEKKQDCKTETQTRNSNEQINNQNKNNEESRTRIRIPIKPKQLKDFYPLSEEDAKALATASGRNYGLRGLNELLRDVAEKLKDRFFGSKAGFMSYMAKLLKYEMRDVERVNNEDFKIRSRETDQSEEAKQERSIAEQEKYLEEIEYSVQVSPEWHLKKKLCAVLERKKAYDLLKSYRFGKIEGDRFKLHLRKQVDLSAREKEIILNQVKATHEGKESRNRIGEVVEQINSLEIVVLESQSKNQSVLSSSNNQSVATSAAVPSFVGLWGKIRQSLISYYKDLGQALDISWFSKLTPEEDHANKKLTLKAPTNFIMDYVQDNYGHLIEQLCKQEQFKLIEICKI